jgi:hypothetical protein
VSHIIKDYSQPIHFSKFGITYSILYQTNHGLQSDRQPGQGGDADTEVRDLRAELLKAEAAHFAKSKGHAITDADTSISSAPKRQLESGPGDNADEEEDPEAKRRRVLEETRDIDADSDGSDSDSSEEERWSFDHHVGMCFTDGF